VFTTVLLAQPATPRSTKPPKINSGTFGPAEPFTFLGCTSSYAGSRIPDDVYAAALATKYLPVDVAQLDIVEPVIAA
jgi:hypothetical protein